MDVNAFENLPNWTSPTGSTIYRGITFRNYSALKPNPEFQQLCAAVITNGSHNNGILTKPHLLAKWWEVFGEISPVLLIYQITRCCSSPIPSYRTAKTRYWAYLEQQGLFTLAFGTPVFNVNGSYKFGGYVTTSDSFTITDPCSSGGTIYYADGSDPRLPAGSTTTPAITLMAEDVNKKVLVPTGNIGSAWRLISYND